MNRLVVIDGNAILHRAYHALPEWRNRDGEATSGVYGFFSMLLKVRDEFAPKFLVVVFDHPSPTFRHSLYVGYQHGRTKDRQLEEDIWGQVEKLKSWFVKLGVAVFQVEGFEADDVIGTVTIQANKPGAKKEPKNEKGKSKLKVDEVIIVTGDRDLLQLVNKTAKVYMPTKGLSEGVLLDRKGVFEKMGVWPEQIVDYKALVGDASDSYPGVPGVGPVTAAKMILKFGGVEEIYKSLDKVDEKVAKKLIDGQESSEVSGRLAEIRTDVPVTLDLGVSRMPEDEKLVFLFKEMNYPSLVKRITGESELEIKKKPVHKATKKAEGQIELV